MSTDILTELLAVIPAAEERMWCERIAARLDERCPDVYSSGAALR